MLTVVHCPFCEWVSRPDSSRGAPAWDWERALYDLAAHVVKVHPEWYVEIRRES